MKTNKTTAGRYAHRSFPCIISVLTALCITVGIAHNALGQATFFWTDVNEGAIYRMDAADGTSNEALLTATMYHPAEMVVDEGEGKVYWVEILRTQSRSKERIRRANLDGTQIETLVEAWCITSIALDIDAGKMYWMVWQAEESPVNAIYRANLDGSEIELVKPLGETTLWFLALPLRGFRMALDGASGKLYWTYWDAALRHFVLRRANLDGSEEETVVADSRYSPDRIALDLSAGMIYWTDGNSIYRANLDGSEIAKVVTSERDLIGALLIDPDDGRLYWTDYDGRDNVYHSMRDADLEVGRIMRANLDGTDVEEVITNGPYEPRGLVLTAGQLYWLDRILGRLQRADLDGSNTETLITSSIADPQHLALDEVGGKMYWIETNLVRRANLDGSDVENLVFINNQIMSLGLDPSLLALDAQHGKLYWRSWDGFFPAGTEIIQADLDGTNITTLTSGHSSYFSGGFSVDPVHEKLYWTFDDDVIYRTDPDGSNDEVFAQHGGRNLVFAPTGNVYYFTNENAIYRENMDGRTGLEMLAELAEGFSIEKLMLDFEAGKMYWVSTPDWTPDWDADDASFRPWIVHQANLDGSGVEIVTTIDGAQIGDMALLGSGATVAIETNPARSDAHLLRLAYPNPFNGQTHLTLTVAHGQHVRLDLFDMLGRLVNVVYRGYLGANTPHRFIIDGAALPSGVYIYRVTGEDFQEGGNVVLLR